ncbi:hypothetical protein ACIPPJ_30135 [Streptomyces sp. NPDC086091]|uniref:hypothetical protein n=1 Tax=Streptomyces sp. NPDC086091 TaxID=3365751 RepID=UPI003812856B
MNTTSRPIAGLAAEHFDAETLALLEALEVPTPEFSDVDLDVVFGTPLEMYEPWGTPREMAAFATRPHAEVVSEFFARRYAAMDILAADPSITELVRERLADVLLPHAAQLRVAPSAAAEPLPLAA